MDWRVTMRPDLGETRSTHEASESLVKTPFIGEFFSPVLLGQIDPPQASPS